MVPLNYKLNNALSWSESFLRQDSFPPFIKTNSHVIRHKEVVEELKKKSLNGLTQQHTAGGVPKGGGKVTMIPRAPE